ncbi:CehA/McbA family metallohydrolase domain-containing protein [Neorhodopirellula lusitana]
MRCTTILMVVSATLGQAAEGTLTLRVVDEASGEPIAARVELTRPTLVSPRAKTRNSRRDSIRVVRPLPARGTIGTSFGFVLEDSVKLNLKEGPYEFRVTRGPEYRVIRGNFAIEKTSEDEHVVSLPRILDMEALGWTSGDCLVPKSDDDLARRMSSEMLQVAWEEGGKTPLVDVHGGLAFYQMEGVKPEESTRTPVVDADLKTLDSLKRIAMSWRDSGRGPEQRMEPKVAIENPFAWPLPVYLASQQIDGCFVLGDWLRLDAMVSRPSSGRPYPDEMLPDNRSLGREAEQIYWEMLSAGFRMAPLAGTGEEARDHPVGYNRLYVATQANTSSMYERALANRMAARQDNADGDSTGQEPIAPNGSEEASQQQKWWDGVWRGESFVTNGPLLQPKLNGHLPGHVFQLGSGEELSLTPELTITVQDPVEYLEVIYNGMVHTTSKLDEFAKAGGRLKPIRVDQSGWALIRVVTLYEGHFRAATSAPWYFEVDGKPRISKRSVDFFQKWLADYEADLKSHRGRDLAAYAPFIRAARQFWQDRADQASHR